MSATSLVRPSSTNNLATSPQKFPSPSALSSSVLPKLNLTPRNQPKESPSTPKESSSPAPSTPGQWQHPRMEEVVRRQNKTKFDNSNVRLIAMNSTVIAATFALRMLLDYSLPRALLEFAHPYDSYMLFLVRAFFGFNIVLACLPLFRNPDTCEDIPLTPAQRQLLGLPPMTRSATPQEKESWVTPPRYNTRSRSDTPGSASSSLQGQTGSPLSGRGTALDLSFGARGSPSGSSFGSGKKQAGSPYAAGGQREGSEKRRLSYNGGRAGSPLGLSEFDGMGSMGTPSKNTRASVGLNSKWLYEKGRGSPNTWGSGSVFS